MDNPDIEEEEVPPDVPGGRLGTPPPNAQAITLFRFYIQRTVEPVLQRVEELGDDGS